jgi:hypothetical protein
MDSLFFFTTSQENGIGQQVSLEFFHTLIERCHLTSLEIFLEGLLMCFVRYSGIILVLMFNLAHVLLFYMLASFLYCSSVFF